LSGVKNSEVSFARVSILAEGTLKGYKKTRTVGGADVITTVEIPAHARRSNATGRKCRAEFVDVIANDGGEVAISKHDSTTIYVVGVRVTCQNWDDNRWNECSGGIHFFITREEAEAY